MTLAAIGSSRRRQTIDDGGPFPESSPYNVESFMTFSDPYGNDGSAVHPDVVDFGASGWQGHRFWIVNTPYHQMNFREENPCIYSADQPATWAEAADNPVYPPPANLAQWNSDPALEYDPVTSELILLFRDGTFTARLARSLDGQTWPTVPSVLDLPGVAEEKVSPTIVRVGDVWHLWAIAHPSRILYHWTAAAPEGPWSPTPQACSGWSANIWHFVIRKHGSRFICLMNEGSGVPQGGGTVYAASSLDGVAWERNPTPVLVRGAARLGMWDETELYRCAMSLHENGTHVRVWYSGRTNDSSVSWRIGYTLIPLSEWPEPPP